MSDQQEHERQLILSFILPARQERYLLLLANSKRREDITRTLAHFKHLDERYTVQISPRLQHTPEILGLLKAKGAPDVCFAISEDEEFDGRKIPLTSALRSIVGRGISTFLSCIAGRLGYFEDEDQRWILERAAKSHARQ